MKKLLLASIAIASVAFGPPNIPDLVQPFAALEKSAKDVIYKGFNMSQWNKSEWFREVEQPKIFMPAKKELSGMDGKDREQRVHYWLSLTLLAYLSMVALGTSIMVVGPRTFCRKRSSQEGYMPVDRNEDEPIERNEISTSVQRKLVMATFLVHFTIDLGCVAFCVRTGRLSKKYGMDYEMWFLMFCLHGIWLCIQACVAAARLPGNARFAMTAFMEGTISGTMPIISDPYDTLRDMIFAGLLCSSRFIVLRAFGGISVLYLLVMHLVMIWPEFTHHRVSTLGGIQGWVRCIASVIPLDGCMAELAASYLPILLAAPASASKVQVDYRAHFFSTAYKQTTQSKVAVLGFEGGPQAALGLLYVCLEGGSMWVTIFNLAIPAAQLAFAKIAHRPLARIVAPWLASRIDTAIDNGRHAIVLAVWQELDADIFCLLVNDVPLFKDLQQSLKKDDPQELFRHSNIYMVVRFSDAPYVDMSLKGITHNDIDALARPLGKNTALKTLNLDGNKITSIDALAPALEKNTALQQLQLNINKINSIDALAPALEKNTALQSLYLMCNKITSIDALAPALEKNTALRTLDLMGNEITSIDALAPALEKNTALQNLQLYGNRITSIDALAPALEKNTALQSLDLAENKITSIDALVPALEKNTALEDLHLARNKITAAPTLSVNKKLKVRVH